MAKVTFFALAVLGALILNFSEAGKNKISIFCW